MITFVKENWRRFRAPSEKGRVLAWPWVLLAVAVVSVFHGIAVTVCAAVGWLWRQAWPRRAGGPNDDGPGASVFYPAPAGRPSGAGQAAHQQAEQQQLLAAQLRAEREQAWADEQGFLDDCDDDESMFEDEAMFDQGQHHAQHRGDGRGEGRHGDFQRERHRQHHQHHPRRHGRHGRRGRRGRHRRNGRHGQGLPQLRLGGRGGVLVKLCA